MTNEEINACVSEESGVRRFRSPEYNWDFNLVTGHFTRWGKTDDDDPIAAPSPEILDIEISSGNCNGKCPYCYKGNDTKTEKTHMTLETFDLIMSKFNKNLGQIALGITGLNANPDFHRILESARHKWRVIPNFVTNGLGMTNELADYYAKICGAVAVSINQNIQGGKETCYEAVNKLLKAGLKQTNIHCMISEETFDFALEVLKDIKEGKIPGLNAVVFLGLKPKGSGSDKKVLSQEKFDALVALCLALGTAFGFDSCSTHKFERAIKNLPLPDEAKVSFKSLSEPCEAFGLFSIYVNAKGLAYPCSFCEGEPDFRGFDIKTADDVLTYWNSRVMQIWRQRSLCEGRKCLIFPEINV